MLILNQEDIIAILKDKTPSWVSHARDYNTTLVALVEGDGFKSLLSKVTHIEKSEPKWAARNKYSRSIVDLNERILRPIENVFSATGGAKEFYIKSENDRKKLINGLSNANGNKSLSKWMATTWKASYVIDPQSVTFVEVDKDGLKSYPTYKSIQNIKNYKTNGQQVEWIAFEPYKVNTPNGSKQYQRFVDGQYDYLYLKEGNNYTLLEEQIKRHDFGRCPAIVNGDNVKIGTNLRLSILDKVIELEKEYLRDQSILTIVKFLNGFKNLVRPKILCRSCHGAKKKGDNLCTSCDGSGFLNSMDVTDEIVLPIDLNNPEQKIPSAKDIAQYVGLDTETWNQYRIELKVLEIFIYEALWGTHMANQENKTATAKFIDTQPVINRLNGISDNAEYVEWSIIELMANFYLPVKDKKERASSVAYGRRFIIDPPDEIIKSYIDFKAKGANTTILDKLHSEYLTAKFKSDEEGLRVALLKSKIEPYLHYSLKEIYDIFGEKEALKKAKFKDFWQSLKSIDLSKSEEVLKIMFNQFIDNYEYDSSVEEAQDVDS